jgi:hypothetical protein
MFALGQVHARSILTGRYANKHTKFDDKSWPPLAAFNVAGFITFDCQDAKTRSQRSYVDGFMPKKSAMEFSDALNTSSNMVSIVIPVGATWDDCSRIAMHTERAIIANQIPMHIDKDVFLHFARQIDMSLDMLTEENAVILRCFDPVWGRSALDEHGLFKSVSIQFT